MLANSGSMVRCRDIGSYLSAGGIPVSRSRLDVVVETIAGLAVSTDILGLLANIRPTQKCFLGILKRMQANRAQGDERCSVGIACITTAHKLFLLLIVKKDRVCKKPTVWSSVIPGGGLNLFLGFLPHLSSTPRGGLGTFWRRICTAPSAFRPPRLLCGRAASYGSIIVWKYQEAAYSIFKVRQLRACPPFGGSPLL